MLFPPCMSVCLELKRTKFSSKQAAIREAYINTCSFNIKSALRPALQTSYSNTGCLSVWLFVKQDIIEYKLLRLTYAERNIKPELLRPTYSGGKDWT